MKKYIFLIFFGLTLFFLAKSEIISFSTAQTQQTQNTDWFVYLIQNESDWDGDGIPDLRTEITPFNESFLEMNIKVLNPNLNFNFSVCNISGVNWVQIWYNVTNASAKTCQSICKSKCPCGWRYLGNFTPTQQCYNYSFASSIYEANVRLNFNSGYKYIQMRTGNGSEIKEAMTAKYFNQIVQDYRNWEEWIKNKTYQAYLNGEEVYFQDFNINISLEGNKTEVRILVNQTPLVNLNENASLFMLSIVFPKFVCFKYSHLNNVSLACPENYTNYNETFGLLAKEEINQTYQVPEYATTSFSMLNLLVDNKTGNLTYYSLKKNFDENEMIKRIKINPLTAKNYYNNLTTELNFSVDYNLSGNSHCIKFLIPRYSNVTLNVTMPSVITNFTLGNYPEIIVYNYTNSNNLLAKIRVYPCCGIQNMTMQEAEVCS
jgi:hypothetical protein